MRLPLKQLAVVAVLTFCAGVAVAVVEAPRARQPPPILVTAPTPSPALVAEAPPAMPAAHGALTVRLLDHYVAP